MSMIRLSFALPPVAKPKRHLVRAYFFGVLGILAGLAFLIFYFGFLGALNQ